VTYERLLRGSRRVVTVCQHIHMLEFQDLFSQIGVTDVFWSHAVKGMRTFPEHYGIRIHPFPLYPVQCTELDWGTETRKYLFSFIGARTGNSLMERSSAHVLDLLGDDPRGLVRSSYAGHDEKSEHEHQTNRKAEKDEGPACRLVSPEFSEVLRQSIFSLCPAGAGPHPTRLWESIACGAIPVILSDAYLPPGKRELWKQAAFFCDETKEAITLLPGQLEKIASDKDKIAGRHAAMKEIWKLYGPNGFVHDIRNLFGKYAAGKPRASHPAS
jgi:hypothetical protein